MPKTPKPPEPNRPPAPIQFQAPLSPDQRAQLEDDSLDWMLIQTRQLQIDLAAEIDSPFTIPQRISGLKAVATVEAIYFKLRAMKKGANEQPGSTVRHFEGAFAAASSTRRGEGNAGSDADELELEDHLAELERDDSEGDPAH